MQITRFTDYAIRVLMQLALREEQTLSTAEIAQSFSISKHHLNKVIQELNRQGWIRTQAGPSGGAQINKETLELHLSEVINTLEDFELTECFDSINNTCPINSICKLRGIFLEARDAFLAVLEKYTIKDLIERREDLNFFLS
jgi:Rrf2 family nitric oxide-sensitive transcriptional repressor